MGLGLHGCGQQTPSSTKVGKEAAFSVDEETTQRVEVIKPQRRDITFNLKLPANIAPWYQATLYAKVPGYLKWIGFDKGDVVKKGELLAEIDAPEIQDAFQQAETDFQIKQLTYERLAAIWSSNPDVIAKQDVDIAEAAAKSAEHQRNNRRILLGYTKIYAPFSGILTARFADPGALIQAATGSASQAVPLFTIMDINSVRVYVNVPQESALMATPGVPLILLVNELPGQEFAGSITRRTEVLDPVTRTLLVEGDIPNPGHRLRPGMYGQVTLQLAHHENALAIPPDAIGEDVKEATNSVYVIEKGKKHRVPFQFASVFVVHDGTVRRASIKVGIDDGVWVEVLDGLHEDDEVVVVGKSGLKEGDQIVATAYKLPEGEHEVQKL